MESWTLFIFGATMQSSFRFIAITILVDDAALHSVATRLSYDNSYVNTTTTLDNNYYLYF